MSKEYKPIPIPLSQRIRELRVRVLPFVVFLVITGIVVYLWDLRVNTPGFSGKVVADSTIVVSPADGQVQQFYLTSFDKIQKGEPLATVVKVDSAYYQARLNLLEYQIEQLKAGTSPIVDQQRTIIDFEQLKLENMQHRIDLASLRIRLNQKEAEFRRAQKVYEQDGMSEQELQRVESEYRVLESQVQKKKEMVDTINSRLNSLDRSVNKGDLKTPFHHAIKVREQELKVVEEELKPVVLRAPISGVISEVFKNKQEYVRMGERILEIESTRPTHIVGYAREPFNVVPKQGMPVQVRTRKPSRSFFKSHILKIGAHIETLNPGMQRPGITSERGLPIKIALDNPNSIDLIPGEIVDIVLQPNSN